MIRAKPNAVLGLATGSSPLGVYRELAYTVTTRKAWISPGVTCFNLDEYYPMPDDSPHAYHAFMRAHLFDHVNCRRWHVPDGRPAGEAEIIESCRRYEDAIREAGGIDLQLLGIGRTGHIGFNEPGSSPHSHTRLVPLHPQTREDAARDFGSLDRVPKQAVTMGIGTILEAKSILLMASSAGKAEIVRAALEGDVSEQVPASFLQTHPDVQVCLDPEAAHLLNAQ